MSTEEHINQLTAQVAAPTPFSGTQDNLDHFKAEYSLYLSMRSTEFTDKWSSILFVLLYMKGGSAGPWVTQKINRILDTANPAETTWAEFMIEPNEMFTDPNCQATTRRKLSGCI